METIEKINGLKVTFQSEIRTGKDYLDRVTAVYKPAKRRNSAMVVVHGYTMSKEDFFNYGDYLNNVGISTFHLDLPYHGERSSFGDGYVVQGMNMEEIKDGIRQAVSDISKSVDMLEKIGHRDIGVAGYSLGGILTLLMMGKDKRLKKGIAICAGGDLADLILNSPITRTLSEHLRKEGIDYDTLKAEMEEFEPSNYAQNINPKNLLMINGKHDDIVPNKNTEYFLKNLRENPNIQWQNCDHFTPEFISQSKKHLEDFFR